MNDRPQITTAEELARYTAMMRWRPSPGLRAALSRAFDELDAARLAHPEAEALDDAVGGLRDLLQIAELVE